VGLHAHAGSGIRTPDAWRHTADFLVAATALFPEVRLLDLGGGLGVVERPGQTPLDLGAVGERLAAFRAAHPGIDEVWLEPGRFLVAEAGVLLATVTQLKRKGDRLYVGCDAGMSSLLRPALYGAWHPIVNLSRLDQAPDTRCDVVGPICETGDVLGHGRWLAAPREGDVLLVAVAGAYGRTMASDYNRRGRPREVLL
jgi:diaminopimelate decarboxylase/aspartate kinase